MSQESDKPVEDNDKYSEHSAQASEQRIEEACQTSEQLEGEHEERPNFFIQTLVYGTHFSTKERRKLYFKVFGLSTLLVWTLIISLVVFKPDTYTSEWTLILPGTGSGQTVNLESIGQASASSASPYSHSSIDPSVNYKAIATSAPVIAEAAKELGLTKREFGKPRIKLVDQTALMNFEIKGSTAQQARDKAQALYTALQRQLDKLRDDEQKRVADASIQTLASFSDKLEQAQQEKLEYQTQSGIVSIEQFNQLVLTLENKRTELNDLIADLQSITAKSDVLQKSLSLTDKQVQQAVNLRNDVLFQDYLKRHAEIHSQIATTEGAWGKNHPKLKQLEASHHSVNDSIEARGRKLVNDYSISIWSLIEIGSTQFENSLFQELIQLNAQKKGLEQEVMLAIDNVEQLSKRVENSASDAIKIEDLGRKQQVATAVFSTALAKQDIGKSDRFASYPLVQILSAPSLPEKADSVVLALAIAGGMLATFSIAIGLILLWLRKPWLQKMLKSA